MAPSSEAQHLNNHHQDTLLKIFEHPTIHNIDWHDVLSLLGAVGTVEVQHDEMYLVRLGAETEVITRPKHPDIEIQLIVDLRRLLAVAGYETVAAELRSKGKEV